MPYIGTPPASELANLDINGQSLILDADADTHITADTDDQIDIHISGADDFQFTANMFKAQSSSQIQADDGSEASPGIIFSGDTGVGFWRAAAAEGGGQNLVGITTDNASGDGFGTMILERSRLHVNDDTVNSKSASGITVQQHGYDDEIISLKSSDVSHGVTDISETDTFGMFSKAIDATGGLEIVGIRDTSNTRGLVMKGFCSGLTDSASTSARAAVEIHGFEYSGANATNATANGLIFGVRTQKGNAHATIFLVDEDGDISYDGSDAGAYDEYEDAQLTRALDLSHGRNVIDSKFDKFIAYNHEKLADLKLVGREENGEPNHFINLCGMQRLHNGAIWQQYEKHQNLLNAVYELAVKSVGQEEADAILEKNEVKLLKNDSLLN